MGMFNKNCGLALLAGLSCVFGFAPFGFFVIPVMALAVLFVLWSKAEGLAAAAWLGFTFGLGLFVVGIGWIYVALHDFGDMPFLLALIATLLFAAFISLLPMLAGYLQALFNNKSRHESCVIRITLVMPAFWVLTEWLRGTLFTGFPWLTFGYAHSDSMLAGYAPLFGVYGVSLVAALSSGLLAAIYLRRNLMELAILVLLWGGGALLCNVSWTVPKGELLSVALVQGNIAQDVKFQEDALPGTLNTYLNLTLQNPARLTVLPETAVPLLRHNAPQELIRQLGDHARKNGGDILIGSFERSNGKYYNSVFSLGMAEEQHYRKQHLVPFGEFIPLRPLLGWLINGVLDIPMGDLGRGDALQATLNVAEQHVAANICYEDAFGEEIIRALPKATLLVNFTNDAWYGHSHAAAQHNQISQLRALESGRMMLRATNTGVTSIIGKDGKLLQQLPQHQEGVLKGMVQGYEGATPYVRWGNAAVMLLMVLMLAFVRRNAPHLTQ